MNATITKNSLPEAPQEEMRKNNKKSNATYETIDAQRRTAIGEPPWG